MNTREERKALLKEWMTGLTQIFKFENPMRTSHDLSSFWNVHFGIKMNETWVNRALYRRKK